MDIKNITRDAAHAKVILLIRDPRDIALSDAYRRVFFDGTYKMMSSDIVDITVDSTSRWWGELIAKYIPFKPLIVQYEFLCLYPIPVLETVLQYLGNPDRVMHIMDAVKKVDRIKTYEKCDKDKVSIKPVFNPHVEFNDGVSRFTQHCLKWQRDEFFLLEHNETIWQHLKDIMMQYGYTEYGYTEYGHTGIN